MSCGFTGINRHVTGRWCKKIDEVGLPRRTKLKCYPIHAGRLSVAQAHNKGPSIHQSFVLCVCFFLIEEIAATHSE